MRLSLPVNLKGRLSSGQGTEAPRRHGRCDQRVPDTRSGPFDQAVLEFQPRRAAHRPTGERAREAAASQDPWHRGAAAGPRWQRGCSSWIRLREPAAPPLPSKPGAGSSVTARIENIARAALPCAPNEGALHWRNAVNPVPFREHALSYSERAPWIPTPRPAGAGWRRRHRALHAPR